MELEKWGLEVGFELEVIAFLLLYFVLEGTGISSISTIPAEEDLFWKLRPTKVLGSFCCTLS